MVAVEHHHLGRPPGDAARLGGAGRLVEHLEEAHQARAGAAAGEPLHLAAQFAEVGATSRAVLEDPRLVVDEAEDRVEVVRAALDETGRDLRSGVRVLGPGGHAGRAIDRVVPARALDLVLVPEAAVEPHRAVECADLVDQHVGQFGLEALRVGGRGEVAAEGLPGVAQRVGDAADELADRLLGAALGRNPGLAEVLADRDVGGQLRPLGGNFRVVHLEDHFAVGAGDLGRPPGPADLVEDFLGGQPFAGGPAGDRQAARPSRLAFGLSVAAGRGVRGASGQGGQGCGIMFAGLGHVGFFPPRGTGFGPRSDAGQIEQKRSGCQTKPTRDCGDAMHNAQVIVGLPQVVEAFSTAPRVRMHDLFRQIPTAATPVPKLW